MMRLLLCAVLACTVATAGAATFEAQVTHVTDGDTVWVRPPGGTPESLRISGIDAPEICQAFGREAREALAARVLRRQVVVEPTGHDDYLRLLAQLKLDDEDVGAWLVAQGFAWSHRWRRRPGPYAALEKLARREHRGLWAQASPQDPREFRREHGRCEH
jgi:endonuclease YncB( thermonuclease family)